MAECALVKEERDVLGGEIRDVKEGGGMKSFHALDMREKMMAILGDR